MAASPSLQNDRLSQQAEALENQGKWAQAAALQRQRLALDPGSVWVTYRLSQDLWQAGQRTQADTLMRNLAQQKPNDPDQVYAYGLYLSGHDQERAALAHINNLPRAQWNGNIQELVNRLQSDQVLETANRLRDSGKEQDAEAMLRQQPPSTRIDLTLADWAQQRRDDAAARAAYQNVLAREPNNADAILGLTEVDIAAGDKAAARSQLAKLPATDNASLNTQRRVALVQAQLGDTAAAQRTFNTLIPQAKSQPPSMESAMILRDGAGISLSYDRGEANGVWASLSGDRLTGKNVEDNWRVRWMTGYYYKIINENNRRVTIGLNNMIWHYDKDLSGYSLGQGGYYSPQEYLSFAVPVMWRERTENWSWELGASGSWSHSRTKTMPRYPLMNLIPTDWQEEAAQQSNSGSSSQGFGYTARALLERRVTSNWFVGTAIDIQKAKDYAPSHFQLYVRYSAAGWQGDMDLPPQPLIPYADW